MKKELIKETIERTLVESVETDQTVSVEYHIKDENDNNVGNATISKHGVNISLYGSEFDLEVWKEKLDELITETIK